MLSGRSTHADTTADNTVNLTVSLVDAALLVIILHITKRSLVRKRTDGSRFKRLSLTKDNLRIFMCLTLILSGEVKVDIRLLVSLKSEECLERNIKSFLRQWFAASRTDLIRHIAAASSGIRFYQIRIKITVFTMLAQIMRMQRIYLRDTGHCRDKRTAYGASRSYQIAILV